MIYVDAEYFHGVPRVVGAVIFLIQEIAGVPFIQNLKAMIQPNKMWFPLIMPVKKCN